MPGRLRLLYSTLSLTFFFLAAAPIYRELARPSDIWWTPPTMLVSLAESKDRVEIYVRRRPLAALLEARQLQIVEGGGSTVLAPSEVGFRFNNWDRVRAERLPLLLLFAASCGVTAFLFLLVVTGRLAYRGEKPG